MVGFDVDVFAAELEAGISPAVLMARNPDKAHLIATLVPMYGGTIVPIVNAWLPEEEEFLDKNLGVLSTAELSRRLGRSPDALKIRRQRAGFVAPSKRALSAHRAGKLLGMDIHSVIKLIELGRFPARKLPGMTIWAVGQDVFRRWAINPLNWIYFKFYRIQDPILKRLIAQQRQRWPDAWWTPGRVAQYHGQPDTRMVNKYIREGRLPAVQWGNWWILRSGAMAVRFYTRSELSQVNWTPEADAFMVLAQAVGLSPLRIAELMKREQSGVDNHMRIALIRRGRVPEIIEQNGLDVYYEGGRLWTDWRLHAGRFPGLARTVRRFKEGKPLSEKDRSYLRGVIRSWARWFANGIPERERLADRMRHALNATPTRLSWAYKELKAWGIDPFDI